MKKLLIAAAAFAALATAANAQQVRIGSEGAYAPWNFIDNDTGQLAGFEIDLGNDLCARAGLECTWVQNEWDSIIPNLLAGNYDAIMAGMSITDERRQTIDFSANYFPPDPAKYMMLESSTVDPASMSGVRVGVQGATIHAAYAEQNHAPANTIVSFETADQAFADLQAGNVDVILADGAYIDELVAGSGGTIKTAGPTPEIGQGVGVGLRKEDDELEQKFNDALTAAKADGTVDRLIVQWFPEKEGQGPFFQ
jgi:polar amino acid transport system substrate-binding protein